ncbi:MAG: FAD-binding oxidoreductase [Proteobacteria bacterium]|nr:FAD-binding oxidoreductase [Pseudomonadota bacterium]
MLTGAYKKFYKELKQFIPKKDIITNPLWTLAHGTDASFYRLIPKIVVNVQNESQVIRLLKCAKLLKLPVTFRAAGTSLSGQSITDSILVRLGPGWHHHQILQQGEKIKLEPGIIGSQANRLLVSYGKKIGPDPASIDAAKIGGILANNASGMCCGVAQNSYQTIDSMRIVFLDGSVVDTADEQSKRQFQQDHPEFLEKLTSLRRQVVSNSTLKETIQHKYKIKNTTGYSLNALVDFEDPFEILQHLMIGSEGTLGFISEVVYKTVTEHAHKASALIMFPDMKTACDAIPILKKEDVAAAELMDRASLRSVEDKQGMPEYLKTLAPEVTALLVETRAGNQNDLNQQIKSIIKALGSLQTVQAIQFTDQPSEFSVLWNIRKGLFPAVGAVRETGTTVIIEDVAFPIEQLANAALDLQKLFVKFDYTEAIIFGHALEGNLHFVFTQDFSLEKEVNRYRDFMADVVKLVVEQYHGSLKAEHGTGRNMAPFVEKEWGTAAFNLMKEIKNLFDPENLLNPGVILNDDQEAHLKDLKPLPATNNIVDTCIECGFCEPVCPSKDLSFTPRHRIVGRREISRLSTLNNHSGQLQQLVQSYQYPGVDTCATDGLCGTRCPVGIDTGKLVKQLRQEANSDFAGKIAQWTNSRFSTITRTASVSLSVLKLTQKSLGSGFVGSIAKLARLLTVNKLPAWNRRMPGGVPKIKRSKQTATNQLQVVYFPSCASRTMDVDKPKTVNGKALPQLTMSLLNKANYDVVLPENLDSLCCGQVYESKGFLELADRKRAELINHLNDVSQGGALPILFDTSPCLFRVREDSECSLQLYEPLEFVLSFLVDRLTFRQLDKNIALHLTCSSRKMGLENELVQLANLCADKVVVPEEVYCCGFAGDRGFNFPELNESALNRLADQVKDCDEGYSTSVTCEIGLALHGKIPYRSILYLVNEASVSKD